VTNCAHTARFIYFVHIVLGYVVIISVMIVMNNYFFHGYLPLGVMFYRLFRNRAHVLRS
jgi:hypothetical protein